MRRRSNSATPYERSYVVLNYLKRKTNKEHKTSIKELLNIDVISRVLKSDDALSDMLKTYMSLTCEQDDHDQICCDNTDKIVKNDNKYVRFGGIYYESVFSYDDIDALIESLRFSKTLDTDSANELINKIKNNLTDDYYSDSKAGICNVKQHDLVDKNHIRNHLTIIQSAINDRCCISFNFNAYNQDKKLQQINDNRYIISPFYTVAYNGKYYLIAGMKKYKSMSIWRIDLMTELEKVTGAVSRENRVEKSECDGVPVNWEDNFIYHHLNMSFDKPQYIKLKVYKDKKFKGADYTFLYDHFGDTFSTITSNDDYNVVRVKCSPFAIANFALQYSDKVEVIEPTEVREKIQEKIKNLQRKYEVNYGI